jgi:hypothetical protein
MIKFKHLEEIKMTYFQHFLFAIKLSATFFLLSFTSLMHAILPCIFVKTASDNIKELNNFFEKRN